MSVHCNGQASVLYQKASDTIEAKDDLIVPINSQSTVPLCKYPSELSSAEFGFKRSRV
jgi:hypothetical protein